MLKFISRVVVGVFVGVVTAVLTVGAFFRLSKEESTDSEEVPVQEPGWI